MYTERKLQQFSFREVMDAGAWKFLHRLAHEVQMPRHECQRTDFLLIWEGTAWPGNMGKPVHYSRHIYVSKQWLMQNLTKKEYAQYVALRCSVRP